MNLQGCKCSYSSPVTPITNLRTCVASSCPSIQQAACGSRQGGKSCPLIAAPESKSCKSRPLPFPGLIDLRLYITRHRCGPIGAMLPSSKPSIAREPLVSNVAPPACNSGATSSARASFSIPFHTPPSSHLRVTIAPLSKTTVMVPPSTSIIQIVPSAGASAGSRGDWRISADAALYRIAVLARSQRTRTRSLRANGKTATKGGTGAPATGTKDLSDVSFRASPAGSGSGSGMTIPSSACTAAMMAWC